MRKSSQRLIVLTLLSLYPTLSQAANGLQSSAPINITADKLIVDQEKYTATFTGNVEALQQDVTLKAAKMVVHYLKGNQENNNISRIEVFENVVLLRPSEVVKGDKGVYDVLKDTLVITGKVVLTKDNNMVQGTNLVYNLKTGKSEISGGIMPGGVSGGRVKGTFVPKKD